MKYWPPKEFLN